MPNLMHIRKLLALFALLCATLVSSAAWAQTTGQLKGQISDEEELGIPGVSVSLHGSTLIGGSQTRSTDGDGNFGFVELLPGTYEIVAQKPGFQGITITGIVVNANNVSIQNLTLKISSSNDEIVVEAKKPVVDVEDTSRGEVLTKEFLDRIPAGRSYQSAVQMVAGVVGGSNPNIAGAAYNENTYMLDGINITDPVTGTFSLNFNYDAIQQIEVILGGYMPEYGTSLGGVVNVVTQSGSNNLEFDTSVYYNNGNWRGKKDARYTSDGYYLAPTDFDSNFQLIQIGGQIAGPVVRDRAWFLISYEHARSLINNVGIDQPRDFDGHYVLGKLTAQPNASHRFTLLMQMNPTGIDNTDQGDQYQKPESQTRQYQSSGVVQARWQWFLAPEVNLDTQVSLLKEGFAVGAVPCTHNRKLGYHPCRPGEEEGDIDWDTPGRFGSFGAYDSVNAYYYTFDNRLVYNASSKLTVVGLEDPLGGTHDLKFGVEGSQTVWDQTQGYNGNVYYVDMNAVPYDPQTFQNYYWIESTSPIQFRTTGSKWNLFVQDAWKPISNLVIKGGVRFDHTLLRNDVGDPVVGGDLFGPRLYASWDPFGDQKTKIAGGYGRFNDTGNLGVADFTSVGAYGYKLFLGEYFDDGGGTGFLNNQAQMYDIVPQVNHNTVHEKIRMPRSDEFTLTVARELVEDVGVETSLTYKITRNLFEPDDQNLIYDQDGSAVIGSRFGDATLNKYRLRSPTEAKRDYMQWDVRLYKVDSRRWFGTLTYTYTQSIGSSSSSLSGSFINDPQSQYNYGPFIATDYRHVVKGYAAWNLPTDPWDQEIGGTFQFYGGPPLERLYWSDVGGGYGLRIRPRDAYTRFPPYWELGLRFAQNFDVRKGKLELSAQATNLFNNRAPYDVDYSAFVTQNRLLIYSRQEPIRLQLGARYEF